MLNEKAFANAVTGVTGLFYVVCAVLSYLAPDLIFSFAKSWMHTVNLDSIKAPYTLDAAGFLYGLVTLMVITWVTTYLTIALYNRLAGKK